MLKSLMVAMLVLCATDVAHAQTPATLGDLLDRGAKKLTQAELKQQLSGATISGTAGGRFPTFTFKNLYTPDGLVSGDSWDKGVWSTKNSGKWSVNAAGEFCQDLINDRREKFGSCLSYYVLGNAYYVALGSVRTAEVRERTITH